MTIKVFCNVIDPLGRAIHRVADASRQYAPKNISFVDSPEDADLQVVPTIGLGQARQIDKYDIPFAIWQLCYLTTEEPNPEFWRPYWDKSVLTASYYDLPVSRQDNFLLTNIGFDPEVFYPKEDNQKLIEAVVTGYVDAPVGEELTNVALAFDSVVHVGGDIGLDGTPGYVRVENITDDHMRHLYQSSVYSIALRHSEGFELPVVEGQACGAIGVTFDMPCYRRWFSDFAVLLDPNSPVLPQLKKLHETVPNYKAYDLSQFYWENVIHLFWERLLEQWNKR